VKLAALFSSLLLALLCSATARATDPRVDRIIGATSDAYEAAAVGDSAWIATSGGLVIETGGRVARILTSLDGLLGTRLRSISVLPEGVYVGGVDGTTFLGRDSKVVRTIPIARVRRVTLFEGARYAGAFGGGVVRLDVGRSFSRVPAIGAREKVTDLLATPEHLYVSTAGNGVIRLDKQGKVTGKYRKKSGLADDVVWDLALDGARIIAATARGLSLVEGDRAKTGPRGFPTADTRAVFVNAGEIRVATFGSGAYLGGQRLGRARDVRSVTGDLVVHTGGIDRVDSKGHASPIALGGLPSADVTSLARGESGVWIGTFDRGLARIDLHGRISRVPGVDPRVNDLAILADSAGTETLLVATDGGVFQVKNDSATRVADSPREHTSAVTVDARTRDAWVAGAHTLARLRGGRWTRWRSEEVPALAQLATVTVDSAGTVWTGGLHGLVRFDPAAGRAEVRRSTSGMLAVDWMTACAPWQGGLAVGTYNGGLSFFDAAGGVRLERESDGLPAGWVNAHSMRVVGDELWFGALDRGLVYGKPGAWKRLGLANGLPSADVTAIEPIGPNSAWVATRGGLAHVVW
jgi:hypothetical protein